ncbi:hypothetical protein GGQ85_001077 [Nitrobacter vulgaris]|uniref:DUF3732 domain-containing protein n=1 Tax=Nitrobacter vulgaris TaxID=29421 RepID=UPI0028651BEB|nr:DUF3732 domain-containing protein [Nitrobacter vulgaris]MDR6303394.1 hypothetical protein [Nitrobacter vulgaris]
MIAQMGNRNNAAARVVGRISLFLENLATDEELERLLSEDRRLKAVIEDIEGRLGADDSESRLVATLSNIAMHMSGYIKGLNGEFNEFPARLDLHNLTVVIDRPGRPVYMNKSGGGASHLAYHLAALHSLHRFAANYKQPIPRFMVIDQPTQVYFPSESAYRAAGGSIEQTEEQQDANLDAVRRLFEILARFTTKDVPGFQLIVTEHANLRDKWFQDALVEDPWTKPPAERQPETCGISIAYDHEMGARRRKLNARKPAIGGLFVNSSEIPENIRLHGWRRSAAQPNLHRNSLLTGNSTGNFANLVLERLGSDTKSACIAGVS